jgi:hypothetical protein
MIDSYDHIKQDLDEFSLPYLARDSITREAIKKIVGPKKSKLSEEKEQQIHKTRLDILKNIDPFIGESDQDVVEDMYNRKIQYIAGNIVLGMLLINKYDMDYLGGFILVWLITNFPF